ncbi:MAG TPA: DUF2889 domain-containing protein [Acidimicrobiales bacterium]|nr:DUF2889 domain-containing protein [Acidimicrobiales bacterium]
MTHVAHFLAEPMTSLPARLPGSFRRTSSVDMHTLGDGTLELRGIAVDPGGSVDCRALVGKGRELISLDLRPADRGSVALLGRAVARGFRAVVDGLYEPGTLRWILLSELPVAALLSGYGSLYTGLFPSPIPDEALAGLPVDICAGWAAPASFMVQIRTTREMPTPNGPVSPGDGAGMWHEMPALEPGSMRRQRLIQRDGDEVFAMFRDSYARDDGVVTVLHEYSVGATLVPDPDGRGDLISTCVATPRVLPWAECPSAAGSAARLVGRRVSDLRALVKNELVGTSTCTHLNDLLASLSQADHLTESPVR